MRRNPYERHTGVFVCLAEGERCVHSVADLTRADGENFFRLAGQLDIRTSSVAFLLEQTNEALAALRAGEFNEAVVLVPGMTT